MFFNEELTQKLSVTMQIILTSHDYEFLHNKLTIIT